jgi:hypothetical protein
MTNEMTFTTHRTHCWEGKRDLAGPYTYYPEDPLREETDALRPTTSTSSSYL